MNEEFIMKNGTVVSFRSIFGTNGIYVYVKTKLDPENYKKFKEELRTERDVVSINQNYEK